MHVSFTRWSFVEDTVVELERSHPETIAQMLLVAHTVCPVNGDGVGISKTTGEVRPTAAFHCPCLMTRLSYSIRGYMYRSSTSRGR